MKRIFRLLTVFCLFFLSGCTGCGSPAETPEPSPAFEIGGKTYYNKEDQYGNAEHAKIWFGKDGSFVLTDNTHDGYYEMQGTWSITEDVITLNVDRSGIGNFTKVLFEISDEDKIILKTMLAGSRSDDVFTTEKPVYTPYSAPPTSPPTAKPDTAVTPAPESSYIAYYNCDQTNPFGTSFVEFHNDGTFSFTEIQGMGATQVNGLYGREGNTLLFSNFDNDFYANDGSKIYNFEMEIYDEDTLILLKDLQESKKGDVFSTSGTKPAGLETAKSETTAAFQAEFVMKHAPEVGVPEQFEPSVKFENNGEFVFTENCYAGMGQYRGTYAKNEIEIICQVKDASTMKGFAGQDVTKIVFKFKDPNTIVLSTDLCMSVVGDEFHLK